MKLTHEFDLPLSAHDAFVALSDVERVASCLPGASIANVSGEDIQGQLTVKVGPMRFRYEGSAQLRADMQARRLHLQAAARSTTDRGDMKATIDLTVEPDGESSSKVLMETDLALTGRAAQFGGTVLKDVSDAIVRSFAARLVASTSDHSAGTVASRPASATASSPKAAETSQMRPSALSASGEGNELSVLDVLPRPSAMTLVAVCGAVVAGALIGRLAGRRGTGHLATPIIVVRVP